MIPDQVRQIGGGALAIVMIDSIDAVADSNDSNGNPTQWLYTGKPVIKIAAGYGTPTAAPSDAAAWPPGNNWVAGLNDAWRAVGALVNIYNMREATNTYIDTLAAVRLGNGVSHSGSYPSGFEMSPLEIGGIYPAIALTVDGALEYWVWQSNGEDGTCT